MAGKRSRRASTAAASTDDAEPPAGGDGMLALHRVRFLDWHPSAVTAMRAAPDGSVLAVAREGGAIELWETEYWTLVQRLASLDSTGATSLEWARSKEHGWVLMATGLSGELALWAPRTCALVSTTDSNGGAIWDMASLASEDATRLALACDDGCVRLFDVEEEDVAVVYRRTFAKTAGKALSIAWHPSGERLVSGHSDGCIRLWQAATGQELLCISAAIDAAAELCVWRVLMLPGGDIASGDSSGRVAVWDASFGTLLASVQRHSGDVMALAASPDGSQLFASGVDPSVAVIRRLAGQDGASARWVYLDCKRPHSHDVRALELVVRPGPEQEPLLVSGGNDAQMYCYSVAAFQKVHAVRLNKCPEKPAVQTGHSPAGKSFLLSWEKACVDLWELSTAAKVEAGKEGDSLEAEAPPSHRLRVNGGGIVTACALSPDAGAIAISSNKKVSLFRVEAAEEDGAVSLSRVKLPAELRGPARHLAFSGSGAHLLVCAMDGTVALLDAAGAELLATFDQVASASAERPGVRPSALEAASSPVVSLATDRDGKWGAVVRTRTVHLLALPEARYHGRVPAPRHISPISAAAFTARGDRMVVATAGNHIAMFQVETCLAMPYWHKEPSAEAERRLETMPGSIAGLSFHPTAQRLIAHTPGAFCLIDFDKPMDEAAGEGTPGRRKRTRGKPPPPGDTREGDNFRVIHLLEPCLFMGYLTGSDAVLVEKPWSEVVKGFPPPVLRHRYGA